MPTEKYPHHFTDTDIEQLGLIIAERLHGQNNPELSGINDEIGAAKTRELLSGVQKKMTSILGMGSGYTVLMLSDAEVDTLLSMDLSDSIKGVLSDGVR